MSTTKRKVQFKAPNGTTEEFVGIYEERSHTSIDSPPEQTEHLIAVLINDQVIRIEGLGYFTHPETGIIYEL